jgi:hypothetical protein
MCDTRAGAYIPGWWMADRALLFLSTYSGMSLGLVHRVGGLYELGAALGMAAAYGVHKS